jgi:hypothetical protein
MTFVERVCVSRPPGTATRVGAAVALRTVLYYAFPSSRLIRNKERPHAPEIQRARVENELVDPLSEQVLFDKCVGAEEISTRWQQRNFIEDWWYLPTTTGLLLWGIGKDTDAGDSNDIEIIEESDQHNRNEHESKGKVN